METVRAVCAHDCPDMCSLVVQAKDGWVVRVQGDPANPYTAGFACAKVNRDQLVDELVRGATGSVAEIDPRALRGAGPLKLRRDEVQRFATPSGKLEFYSEHLAAQGLPAMPD